MKQAIFAPREHASRKSSQRAKKKRKRIHYIQLGRPAPGTVTLLDIPRVFSIGDDNTRISYFRDPPNLSALLRISWFLHPPICLLIDT